MLILASQSPRRKQLLEWAAIEFEVCVSNTDETYPAHLVMEDIPVYIAKEKALAVREALKLKDIDFNQHILAADTVVVLENTIIGKPKDRGEAIEILNALSGKQHRVITGVVLLMKDKEISFADTTFVEFHTITQEQIEFYVDNYKPYDKAGAYAIQEWIGVTGIKSIQGDFYNVMGLPISRVVKILNGNI